ncbi:hypothetical protein B9Z55_021574 [Caenorhabditis nigoni]|uniref:Uncharacterized protein n=1 Tax=Caenorhabditis nigoni TaxID=1611254 RepID=A0A2G5TTH4_9PELO|nr:hypothetical protein B9Z55_021574 [Caenorhabditis nigoni]
MPIRLLFLSVEDIRYALRCMNVSELIAFSLCSKRTKNLAKSSNRIIELIEAEVFENRIRLGVEDDWDQDDPDQDDPHNEFISLDLSDSFINIDRGNGIEVWRKQGFTLSNWIAHFLSIFNKEMVHMFIINDVSLSYLGTIKQLIPKCQKLKISQFCSNDVAKVAFRKLISIAERVVIDKNIFDDENDISGYLTPNLRSLSFLDVENPFKLTVNDLLVLNIANLSIETANITVKEMNRFIKLWMKGSRTFHPPENIRLTLDRRIEINVQEVFKGIEYQEDEDGYLFQLKREDGKELIVFIEDNYIVFCFK